MTLPEVLDGIPDIRAALAADARGAVRHATRPDQAERSAAATAAASAGLGAAGSAVGLARLELLLVKGPSASTVAAFRPDEFLLVTLEPSRATAQVERALHAWASGTASPPRAEPPAIPPLAVPAEAPAQPRGPRPDAWASLRTALLRGQLTEAAALRREIADAAPGPARAGAEPLPPAELDRAMQLLMQGIGTVLAGDGSGGARTLEPLAAASQRNLSLRWLARYWAGRGALRSGASAAARAHLTQALVVAKQLDGAAVAASQWVAAEVLAYDGDHARALGCLAAARAAFERVEDRWGIGQTWLAQARVHAAQQREEEATAAARQAWSTDAGWDEPAVFLARRAILRGDLAEAEGMLRYLAGPAAERVRALVGAVRDGVVTQADAADFLRECDAPPSARAIRALERVAQAAPRFLHAREALAWMLLKVGKYPEASVIFRGLLAQQLTQADRASVMLGLGCIAHAQQAGKDPDARLHAAVMAGAAPTGPAGDAAALPALSTTSLPARSSQLAGAASVFSGRLSVFALPDVVEFVRSARRTGVLVCSSERGMAAVQFRDGRITGAAGPGAAERGAPAPADEATLRRRAEATFREVLRWSDGEFAFNRDADGDAAEAAPRVQLDAQEVLLNVLRQMDEDARARPAGASR